MELLRRPAISLRCSLIVISCFSESDFDVHVYTNDYVRETVEK